MKGGRRTICVQLMEMGARSAREHAGDCEAVACRLLVGETAPRRDDACGALRHDKCHARRVLRIFPPARAGAV